MTTDDADAKQVECDFLYLLSSCGDEFSAKDGGNGVKGHFKSSLNFYVETLEASDFVLDMIRRGYWFNWPSIPHSAFSRTTDQRSELLSNGCIVEHVVPPFCVNPLTVAVGKKLRLVIDLRHVNNCLVKPRFKIQILALAISMMMKDTGFSHGILSPATIMPIFVLITKSISVLLSLLPAL